MSLSILICRLIQAYIAILFARIILSWFPLSSGGGLATVYGFLHALTEPVLAPIRRIIPPIGMGGMGLDLSPLVVFFGLTLLANFVC